MSEHASDKPQRAKTPQAEAKDGVSLQHRDMSQPEPTTLQQRMSDTASGTFVEPRVGFDFSRVPAQTGMEWQSQPLLRTQPMVQRFPKDEAAGSGACPNCPEAEPMTETPGTETETTPASAEPGTESAAPGETPAPALIVEDSTTELGPGQMKKSEFLSQLKMEVCRTVEAAIAGTGRTTDECPYLDYWFDFYSRKDSAHIERSIHRYAPEASGVTTAKGYISVITQRARQAAETWARTGQITGVPEGLPTHLPGEPAAPGGENGKTSTGPVMFKAREGGIKGAENPQAIQAELGEGRPLDSGVRSRMGSAFGMDFTHVRTHTDNTATALSNRLNARAFTVGQHVAFGANQYKPDTLVGDAIIAHELAHTVQQRGEMTATAPMQKGSSEQSALEKDADLSAIDAVGTMWGGIKAGLQSFAKNTVPSLKTGLMLQRCSQDEEKKEKKPKLKEYASPLHKKIAEAAQNFMNEKEVVDAFLAFRKKEERGWFFSINKDLLPEGSVNKPETVPGTLEEWEGLNFRVKQVIGDLAGLSKDDISRIGSGSWKKTYKDKVKEGYNKWPKGMKAVFGASKTADGGGDPTCNLVTGEILTRGGIKLLRSDDKYYSASEIYKTGAAGNLEEVEPAKVSGGDIMSKPGHVEIVTKVYDNNTFCAVLTYRDPGKEECGRPLVSESYKFYRLKSE